MRMAKASKDDIDRLRKFFQMIEEVMDYGTLTHPPTGPDGEGAEEEVDDIRLCELIREHWGHRGPGVGAGSWFRVVFGVDVLIDNCCDPDLDYLEFKPEIKSALEAAGAKP